MPIVPDMGYVPVIGPGDVQESFEIPNGTLPAGWSSAPDQSGGAYVVVAGKLTTSSPSGAIVNVSRAFSFTDQFTVSANLTEGSGFGGLARRYTQEFLIGSNGSLSSGYGFGVYRGDQNYSNSAVVIEHDGVAIATLLSPFQFGQSVHVQATFQLSGEISGFVWDDFGNEFDFDYVGPLPTLTGDRFALQNGAPPDYQIKPTVDDLFLDAQGDSSGLADLLDAAVVAMTGGRHLPIYDPAIGANAKIPANYDLFFAILADVAPQLDLNTFKIDAYGFVSPAQYPADLQEQCVALVAAFSSVGAATKLWVPGVQLTTQSAASIAPGTPVGTFDKKKKQYNSHHSAIFVGTGTVDGEAGFFLLDQYNLSETKGNPLGGTFKQRTDIGNYSPAEVRFYRFADLAGLKQAEGYFTIE